MKKKAIVLMVLMLLVSMTGNVFAYSEGEKVNFRHSTDNNGVDIFNIDGNIGFCAEPGAQSDDSGQMKIEHQGRTSKLAKAYYYCYKHDGNWFSKLNDYGASPLGPYWRLAMEMITQYAVHGQDAIDYWNAHWPASTAAYGAAVKTFVNETCADVKVPSDFRVFIGRQSGQDSAAFYIAPPGYATLKKTSSRATYNNKGASLAGAIYYVYEDQACTKRAKDADGNDITLTTDANGNTNTVQVDDGTYYAKEITASPGYKLDTTVRSVKVTDQNTSNNPAVFQSVEIPQSGWAKVVKRSGNTDITG